ncbi:MAG: putative alpha/beta-fold hydrolase [Myxococcota bacterium]|jgi:predicted alpha/beta-fold hydrolase
MDFRRERIELDDGDFLDLDFIDVLGQSWAALGNSSPICLVLHGLEGSSRAGYACETYRRLAHAGIRPVGFNFRGCSGQPNRLARSYHSGETADPRLVIAWLKHRFGGVLIGAIGFSLGGNVLLKHLGESGLACGLDAAAVVSVPFDLGACSDALGRGFSRIYQRDLLGALRRKLLPRRRLIEGQCDFERGLNATDFRTFDDAITAPIHGIASADAYYQTCSSGRFLSRIEIPVGLVQSLDDPFVPATSVPRQVIADNPNLTTFFTTGGGHVGFVSGAPWRRTFWAEKTAAGFISNRLTATVLPMDIGE